jgi:hypothetical protein
MTSIRDKGRITPTKANSYDDIRQVVTMLDLTGEDPEKKGTINLVTCRATLEERDRLKALAKKYGLAGPSHFFRTCLDRFFEADDSADLELPIDLKRKEPVPQEQEPKRRAKRR